MKVGYVRVSTVDQNESRQLVRMEEVKVKKLYIEKVSGKDIEGRLELKNMLEFVREGDTVYVHDFSRLARKRKIPFEVDTDPFYSKKNLKRLKKSIKQMENRVDI